MNEYAGVIIWLTCILFVIRIAIDLQSFCVKGKFATQVIIFLVMTFIKVIFVLLIIDLVNN